MRLVATLAESEMLHKSVYTNVETCGEFLIDSNLENNSLLMKVFESCTCGIFYFAVMACRRYDITSERLRAKWPYTWCDWRLDGVLVHCGQILTKSSHVDYALGCGFRVHDRREMSIFRRISTLQFNNREILLIDVHCRNGKNVENVLDSTSGAEKLFLNDWTTTGDICHRVNDT